MSIAIPLRPVSDGTYVYENEHRLPSVSFAKHGYRLRAESNAEVRHLNTFPKGRSS